MAAGDKTAPVRPRGQSNMRLDLVDYHRLSQESQDVLEVAVRALLATPKATAGSPTGERWTGSLTANPTSGSDNSLRVDSAVFVGVTSDGKLIVKPAGTALTTTIPAGGADHQVYLYMQDVSEDTQVRRFLPTSQPFTEFPSAIDVANRQTAALYVRAGSIGSVVAEDAVAGVTRSLLFLGIATNTAGNVTFTPAANCLETVTQPATVPATSAGTTTGETTVTGSGATLRDLINMALYGLGLAVWKGSDFVTPSASNNFGAYQIPAGGVDKAYRNALGDITIGNGTTSIGDFNQNSYASDDLLLVAALAALPAQGGRIWFKRGVALTNIAADVTLPAGKTVEFIGDHTDHPASVPQFSFVGTNNLLCTATGALILRNLHIRWTNVAVNLADDCPVRVINCYMEKPSGAYAGAAFTAATSVPCADLLFEDCFWDTTLTADSTSAICVRLLDVARRVKHVRCRHRMNGEYVCGSFSITDMREDVSWDGIDISHPYDSAGAGFGAVCITVSSTNNTTEKRGRSIRNVTIRGTSTDGATNLKLIALTFTAAGFITVHNVKTEKTFGSMVSVSSGPGDHTFIECDFDSSMLVSGPINRWTFSRCKFRKGFALGDDSDVVTGLRFYACTMQDIESLIRGTITTDVEFDADCVFERNLSSAQAGGIHVSATAGNILDKVVIRGTFRNFGDATTPHVRCARITTTYVGNVSFEDIYVHDFQQVAFSSVDAATPPRLFEVNAQQGENITVRNVRARDIMSSSSGNQRAGTYLLDVQSRDRTTDSTSYIGSITIHDVELGEMTGGLGGGGSNSYVMIMRLEHVLCNSLTFSNIKLWTTYKNGASDARIQDVIYISLNGVPTFNFVTLSDCWFNFANPGGVNMVRADIINMIQPAGFIYNFSMCNVHVKNDFSWDFTNAWGVEIDYTITNLTFHENDALNVGRTKFGTVTRTNPSGGVPATGVAWGSNLQWAGG